MVRDHAESDHWEVRGEVGAPEKEGYCPALSGGGCRLNGKSDSASMYGRQTKTCDENRRKHHADSVDGKAKHERRQSGGLDERTDGQCHCRRPASGDDLRGCSSQLSPKSPNPLRSGQFAAASGRRIAANMTKSSPPTAQPPKPVTIASRRATG